jgi:prefoldin subunit 5
MKFMSVIWVVLFVMVGSSVALADNNQSVAPACSDCYDYGVKPWDKVKVRRDQTGQASVISDYVVGDFALTMSVTVRQLNEKAGPNAKPADRDKAVEQAGKEARNQPMPPGLNKRQRRQVKAMMDERDKAIIAAGTGDAVGLVAAVRELDKQVEVIQQEVDALKANDVKQDYAITANKDAIAALTTRIDNLQANDATDPDLDKKLEELKSKLETADSDAKKEFEKRIEELERLVARVEALEDSSDSAEIDELRSQMEKVLSGLDEVSKTAKAADAKADEARKIAEQALALAKTKMDAGLLELGLEGFFSPAIKGIMVEGAYVITKGPFRVALGGALGLALDSGPEFEFDTRIRAYVVVHRFVWLGLFGSMYGVGIPFNDEFGYGGGAIARFTTPVAKESEWSWGIEGWIGPAYEYGQVTIGPPEGAAPGSVYDNQELKGKLVPMGGVTLVFTR